MGLHALQAFLWKMGRCTIGILITIIFNINNKHNMVLYVQDLRAYACFPSYLNEGGHVENKHDFNDEIMKEDT